MVGLGTICASYCGGFEAGLGSVCANAVIRNRGNFNLRRRLAAAEGACENTSIIKLDKIATVSKSIILGEIGEISGSIRQEVNRVLRETYQV